MCIMNNLTQVQCQYYQNIHSTAWTATGARKGGRVIQTVHVKHLPSKNVKVKTAVIPLTALAL